MTLPNNKIFSNARTLTAFLDEKYANGTKINNLLTVCGNHIQKIRDTGNTINANIFQKALNEWAMNALLDEQFKEIGNAKLLNTIECNININDLNKEYNNKIRDIKIPLE